MARTAAPCPNRAASFRARSRCERATARPADASRCPLRNGPYELLRSGKKSRTAPSAPSTKVRLQGSPNQRTSELTAWSVIRFSRATAVKRVRCGGLCTVESQKETRGRARPRGRAADADLQLHDLIRQGSFYSTSSTLRRRRPESTNVHSFRDYKFPRSPPRTPALARARLYYSRTLSDPQTYKHAPAQAVYYSVHRALARCALHPHTVTHRVYVPTQRAALSHMRVSRRARGQPCEALTRAPRRSLCSL